MQKIFMLIFAAVIILLPSCGCSDSSSSEEYSTEESGNNLDNIAGKWILTIPFDDAPGMTTIKVKINRDGSGRVKIGSAAPGTSKTLIDESVNFQLVDNVLLFDFSNGSTGRLYIENNTVYSDDGKRFSRDH